tara:strand:- start:234 stop:494 length:261 start_codon:yes stop_codon:yes gene_type:complete
MPVPKTAVKVPFRTSGLKARSGVATNTIVSVIADRNAATSKTRSSTGSTVGEKAIARMNAMLNDTPGVAIKAQGNVSASAVARLTR